VCACANAAKSDAGAKQGKASHRKARVSKSNAESQTNAGKKETPKRIVNGCQIRNFVLPQRGRPSNLAVNLPSADSNERRRDGLQPSNPRFMSYKFWNYARCELRYPSYACMHSQLPDIQQVAPES
jgi:hypothetical protein